MKHLNTGYQVLHEINIEVSRCLNLCYRWLNGFNEAIKATYPKAEIQGA